MNILKPLTVAVLAAPLALAGCVTDPVTGQQSASKTAVYGLGGAAVVLEEAALGSRAVDGGCLENPDEGAGVGLKARGNRHTQR